MPTPPPLPPDRPDLAERYGVGVGRRRAVVPLVVLGLVLAAMVAATAWGLSERQTGVRAGVLTYGDITPESITITIEVVRPAGQAVVCDVAAVGADKVDVGATRLEVPPAGDERVVVSGTIPTASPAKAARLLGCVPAG